MTVVSVAGGAALAADVATQFRHGPRRLGQFEGESPGNAIGLVWQYQMGHRVIASPTIANGVLYIGAKNGRFVALDAKSGALKWEFQADSGVTSSAAVADGAVFFQSDANTVYALTLDGREMWRKTTGADLPFVSVAFMPVIQPWDFWTSSPLYQNGVVTIGGGDGKVYALDAKTGEERWSFATKGRVRASPASDGETIFIGSMEGTMYALDADSGKQRWAFKARGNPYFPNGDIQSTAALADGLVLFGSRDYHLYALDAKTGREVWRNLHENSWVCASPAVRDGRVYVGSSDGRFMRAVDLKTGTALWTEKADGNIFSSPATVGEDVYTGVLSGTLMGESGKDGKTHGFGIGVEERIYSSPWIENGILYVGSNGGEVFAMTKGVMPKMPE